ncbi:MAG: TetR/AcrR family transcriptional regulator [Planctomycetota bacterium]
MDDSQLAPKQARSFKSQRKILDATLSLLEEQHFENVTIADIAASADMAVGNFYKRFKNKEALLPHLYAEYNLRFREFSETIQANPTDDPWLKIVSETVAFFEANKGIIRALHLHSRLNPTLVPIGSTTSRAGLYQSLEQLVTQIGLNSATRKRRARAAALVMVSTITEAILYPEMTPHAASGLSKRQLTRELVDVLKSYCT